MVLKILYISGITSRQASGLLDISLTHRTISESVWILTGTNKDGSLSDDLKLAMQRKAPVVIYTGMKQIPTIVATYIEAGKGGMTAAIIQHASLPNQKSARGMVKDLSLIADLHQLTYPAIIIIGAVSGLLNE